MDALKIGLQIHPENSYRECSEPRTKVRIVFQREWTPIITADVMEMDRRGCRLRISRKVCDFDPERVLIQFAYTEVIGRVTWTNKTNDYHDIRVVFESAV